MGQREGDGDAGNRQLLSGEAGRRLFIRSTHRSHLVEAGVSGC